MSQQIVGKSMLQRIAGLELNALLGAGILSPEKFNNARIPAKGTAVYDPGGQILFYRIPVVKGRTTVGYADIAAHSAFSEPLLSVTSGQEWDEVAVFEQAAAAAKKQRRALKYDSARLVAFSYPKLAVQFLKGGTEIEMLELGSWKPVPLGSMDSEPPSNFQRWSLVDSVTPAQHKKNLVNFKNRLDAWDDICPPPPGPKDPRKPPRQIEFPPDILQLERFLDRFRRRLEILARTRDLHYSTDNATHVPCYELHGQQTSVWCIAASVQMLLDFYRYNYQQTRIASDLGLGTIANPSGLPYSRDGDMVTVLQNLTSNALTANMNTAPNWNEFMTEIDANRPLISFIPGHSRTVAGYTSSRVFRFLTFQGLLVYDPWPPMTGVITRWENFANHTYRVTFTARVTMI